VNVVAPDKTKKLTRSSGNCSLISDHYQNIDNQSKSSLEKHLGMMEFKDRSKAEGGSINFLTRE